MTWKAMTPVEVCDVIDELELASWPLSKAETHRLAADRFGWTVEERRGKEYLTNTVNALSLPGVTTATGKEYVMSVSLRSTDAIPDPTDESIRFVDDTFAGLVREGERRWGTARIVRDSAQNAFWDTPRDGRIRFTGSELGIVVEYRTPQGTDLERRQNRR